MPDHNHVFLCPVSAGRFCQWGSIETMSGTACRAFVLRKCGLFFWLALGTCVFAALSAFADDFTLQNQSLQLVFRIAPLPGGGISIIKIRDIQAGIDWLTG